MLAKPNARADSAAELGVDPAPLSPWRVVEAAAMPGYRLDVKFRDGRQGVVDMRGLIFAPTAGVFAALRDEALFAQVRVEIGAPVWPGDIDIAPDALYDGVKASAGGEFCVGRAAP